MRNAHTFVCLFVRLIWYFTIVFRPEECRNKHTEHITRIAKVRKVYFIYSLIWKLYKLQIEN